MRNFAIAGIAALAIAGSTAVYAQHRHWSPGHMGMMNPADRAAFADARIAAVHAGLKLTPDQEKLWPPVEAAVRDFAKLRIDRANARMDAQKNDAADPLYKTLDDGQKRRLAILTHTEHRFGEGGWRGHGMGRGWDRDDGGRDRGYDRNRFDRDDAPAKGGPERL
jgi:hypothetical protein